MKCQRFSAYRTSANRFKTRLLDVGALVCRETACPDGLGFSTVALGFSRPNTLKPELYTDRTETSVLIRCGGFADSHYVPLFVKILSAFAKTYYDCIIVHWL